METIDSHQNSAMMLKTSQQSPDIYITSKSSIRSQNSVMLATFLLVDRRRLSPTAASGARAHNLGWQSSILEVLSWNLGLITSADQTSKAQILVGSGFRCMSSSTTTATTATRYRKRSPVD
ncbi:unnamed protein product [Ambrosiozyma monospora]|uniref:Unnamed protein product n=1 Tax=Ambrosiozyma monospora TaxID=43982 RepID=A0A9W6YWK0_AMBMO|nr:unnamed protein product [Ambrosiozyma monospora]